MGIHADIQRETIVQAANGDVSAQAYLYKTFSKAMYNICLRMTGNRAEAEDVLHDAFVLAFKSIGSLKEPAAVAGWLRRIVVNECIRQGKKSIPWTAYDDYTDDRTDETFSWWNSISLDLVNQEIKALPEGCRQVFVLHALEDYSHKDIAASLGISEGTSKSQYHRSRALLRERILKQMKLTDG